MISTPTFNENKNYVFKNIFPTIFATSSLGRKPMVSHRSLCLIFSHPYPFSVLLKFLPYLTIPPSLFSALSWPYNCKQPHLMSNGSAPALVRVFQLATENTTLLKLRCLWIPKGKNSTYLKLSIPNPNEIVDICVFQLPFTSN